VRQWSIGPMTPRSVEPTRELLSLAARRGGMQTRLSRVPLALASAALVLVAACSGPPGSSVAVTDGAAAARLALAQDQRFAGIGPYDANRIGQAGWYKVAETNDGWSVTIQIGWGDCPAGCINEHIWTY